MTAFTWRRTITPALKVETFSFWRSKGLRPSDISKTMTCGNQNRERAVSKNGPDHGVAFHWTRRRQILPGRRQNGTRCRGPRVEPTRRSLLYIVFFIVLIEHLLRNEYRAQGTALSPQYTIAIFSRSPPEPRCLQTCCSRCSRITPAPCRGEFPRERTHACRSA